MRSMDDYYERNRSMNYHFKNICYMVDDMRTQIGHKHRYLEAKIQQKTVGGNRNVFNEILHERSENLAI